MNRILEHLALPYQFFVSGGAISGMGPPPPEYLDDVSALYVVSDQIWVRTSTKDEVKGYLIDVFDLEGVFVDSGDTLITFRLIGFD